MITIDVHARDIVTELVQLGVSEKKILIVSTKFSIFCKTKKNASATSFEWLKQLRYYFEQDQTVIRMANAQYVYGYEYLGASDRLVITPLTVRSFGMNHNDIN